MLFFLCIFSKITNESVRWRLGLFVCVLCIYVFFIECDKERQRCSWYNVKLVFFTVLTERGSRPYLTHNYACMHEWIHDWLGSMTTNDLFILRFLHDIRNVDKMTIRTYLHIMLVPVITIWYYFYCLKYRITRDKIKYFNAFINLVVHVLIMLRI